METLRSRPRAKKPWPPGNPRPPQTPTTSSAQARSRHSHSSHLQISSSGPAFRRASARGHTHPMSNLRFQAVFLLVVLAAAIWCIFPIDKKIRLGKDLAGGVSLVYGVDVKNGDSGDILSQVATNVKSRLDPGNAAQAGSRTVQPISARIASRITMPLPSVRPSTASRRSFEDGAPRRSGRRRSPSDEIERIAAAPEGQRTERRSSRARAGDKDRQAKIELAVQAFQA